MERKERTTVTPEIIEAVKRYKNRGDLTHKEIGLLTGVSETSVARIVNGDYDEKTVKEVVITMTLEQFTTLVNCENIVKEMMSISLLSDNAENMLYFPRTTHHIIERYFPEVVAARLKELQYK